MAQPVLEFREVVKRFGAVSAVDGVNFSVQRGEIFTLLGPSGCGKTTTLRLVAGLEEPDEGEIHLDGKIVAAPQRGVFLPPEKRQLGMVFQSYAIWPHLTVFENVAFPLRVRRESADVIRLRVNHALESVGLGGFADRGATQLPAVNSSVSPWHGRWCTSPPYYCSMNRCRISTPNCASRCVSSCARYSGS